MSQTLSRATGCHSDSVPLTMAAKALWQRVRAASPWRKMQAQPACHSLNSLIPVALWRAAWSNLLAGKKERKATALSSPLWSQSLAAVRCQNSSGDNLHSFPGWSQLLVIGGQWFCLETWPKHTTFETGATHSFPLGVVRKEEEKISEKYLKNIWNQRMTLKCSRALRNPKR